MEDDFSPALFVDTDYALKRFDFAQYQQSLDLYCLDSAASDYDLTGQLVWPGARVLSHWIASQRSSLPGRNLIELGSGSGLAGLLALKCGANTVLTDHNDLVVELLQRNLDYTLGVMAQSANGASTALPRGSVCRFEWGSDSDTLWSHFATVSRGSPTIDLVIGGDLCYQSYAMRPLFSTVKQLLQRGSVGCRFVLGYIERAVSQFTLIEQLTQEFGLKREEIPIDSFMDQAARDSIYLPAHLYTFSLKN